MLDSGCASSIERRHEDRPHEHAREAAHVEEQLEHDPEHAETLLLRAQAQAHWKKDLEAALADANRVREVEPEMVEAYEPRTLALLALDRQAEPVEPLEEAGSPGRGPRASL